MPFAINDRKNTDKISLRTRWLITITIISILWGTMLIKSIKSEIHRKKIKMNRNIIKT